MAPQADGVIANASGAAVRADLNNQLAALFTNHSGATEPATTYAYQWWADTTANQLKLRSGDNLSWITIQELDGTMLMEDGTVGAPGLAFASDVDTGFYRPADNELGIATGGTNAVYIDDAQQVGLGTSSPETPAHIYHATANGVLRCESGDEYVHIEFKDSTTTNIPYIGAQGDNLRAITSGSEAVRIDSSGRLLCGTSSSTSNNIFIAQGATSGAGGLLAIARNNNTPGSTDAIASLNFATSVHETVAQIKTQRDSGTWTAGSSYPTALLFATTADGSGSPTEHFRISSVGELISISVYNNTSAVAANMAINSSGKFLRATSSAKYKTNIETLQDSYSDAVLNVRPVWYQSTCKSDNPEHSWWGFIAEEVAEIDPRLIHWKTTEVTYDENGSAVETPCDPEPEGVQYDRFVPHLLNLIKRQKEQIEAMEARLSALEAQ